MQAKLPTFLINSIKIVGKCRIIYILTIDMAIWQSESYSFCKTKTILMETADHLNKILILEINTFTCLICSIKTLSLFPFIM